MVAQSGGEAEKLPASRGRGIRIHDRASYRILLVAEVPVFAMEGITIGRCCRLPHRERLVERVQEYERDLPRRGLMDPVPGMPRRLSAVFLILRDVRRHVIAGGPTLGIVLLLVEVYRRILEFRQEGDVRRDPPDVRAHLPVQIVQRALAVAQVE